MCVYVCVYDESVLYVLSVMLLSKVCVRMCVLVPLICLCVCEYRLR